MKSRRPPQSTSYKRRKQKDKGNNDRKKPNFIKTFFLAFWIAGTSAEFLVWITDGLVTWALNSALTKFASSVIVSAIVLVIRIVFYQTKSIRSKHMNKFANFFKRCGAYIKANKRTFGGILTSLLSGATAVTVTVLGYTVNLTDIIAQIEQFAWLKNLNINGFDITPLITFVVGGLFCVWNTVAAVSRGWESPEKNAEVNTQIAADKQALAEQKAKDEAEAKAKAQAEAEIEQAKAEAQAQIEEEERKKEQAAREAEENAKKVQEEAERKKAEEAHRQLVEKYKAQLLEEQRNIETSESNKTTI